VLRDDTKKPKPLSIHEQMLADAQSAASAAQTTSGGEAKQNGGISVDIRNIVPASMRGQQGKTNDEEVKDLFELDSSSKTGDFQERKLQLINELD
jgi:hypothetical protein